MTIPKGPKCDLLAELTLAMDIHIYSSFDIKSLYQS